MIQTKHNCKVLVIQDDAANIHIKKMLCPYISEDSISFSTQLPKRNYYDLMILDADFIGNQNVFDYLSVKESCGEIILMSKNVNLAVDSAYLSIFDFWLKPLRNHHFQRVIKKIEQVPPKPISERIGKITISYQGGIDWVEWKDIVRIQADRTYCKMYFISGKSQTISMTLKDMESKINAVAPRKYFFRSHKSHLVNLMYLEKYIKTQGGCLIMKDRSSIPLSTPKKAELLTLMTNI